MTLSYRWGLNPQLLLLTSNIESFRRHGSPIADLPQTFKDLVAVARSFGVRYVWIDCLCIVQDSTEDWEADAPTMRYVYANSVCNVVASASNEPEGGLFRRRQAADLRAPGVIETTLAAGHPEKHFIFEDRYFYIQMYRTDETLYGRGWVYQETFLAPRLLYFTQYQIMWECLERNRCEAFPEGVPFHESRKFLNRLLKRPLGRPVTGLEKGRKLLNNQDGQPAPLSDETLSLWQDTTGYYGGLEFTRPSDKLHAFSGIAKLFQEFIGQEYLAGLWKSRIIEQLDWQVSWPAAASTTYRAPSWSWASIDGKLIYYTWHPAHKVLAELLDAEVTTKGEDRTVNVTGGFLKLRGAVIPASYRRKLEKNHATCLEVKPHSEHIDAFEVWSPSPDTTEARFSDSGEFHFLPVKVELSKWIGTKELVHQLKCLILSSISDSDSIYKRIGWFSISNASQEQTQQQIVHFCNTEKREIILV
jgi:hypothetical protein